MNAIKASFQRVQPGAAMDALSDQELLQRVARTRDHSALTILVSRYHDSAYNVACRLTGSANDAEEVVQESMLGLWLSAKNFQPQNARGWILGIVARKALRHIKKRKRLTAHEKTCAEIQGQRGPAQTEPKEDAERRELLQALRRLLDELPAETTQMLLLYYGAHLSQAEIATELDIPQTTISRRLEMALASLRARFAESSLASAAPFLGTDSLGEALTTGLEAPPGMRERVLEGLQRAAQKLPRASQPGIQGGRDGKFIPGAVLPLGLALAALATGAFGWATFQKSAAPRAPAQAPAAPPLVPTPPPALAAPQIERFLRRWDFNTLDQAKDFFKKNSEDGWGWDYLSNDGQGGSGCMKIPSGLCIVDLHVTQDRLPILVKFWLRNGQNERDASSSSPPTIRNLGCTFGSYSCSNLNNGKFREIRDHWVEVHCLVTLDHSSTWIMNADERRLACIVRHLHPGIRKMVFLFSQFPKLCRIDNLTVQEILPSAVPDVREHLRSLD